MLKMVGDEMHKFVHDVVYTTLNDNAVESVVSCGFLPKEPESRRHNFIYYGGFLVISGSGSYIDADGQSTLISKGDFVQRRPGVAHTTTVDVGEPWVEFYVCFGPLLYETLVSIGVLDDQNILHVGLTKDLLTRCETLLFSFKNCKSSDKSRLLAEVQDFMLYINRKAMQDMTSDDYEHMIEKVCEVLSKDFHRPLDLKTMAATFQMSYENLRKIFKRQTGKSLHQFRILKKIDMAKRLLMNLQLSIKSIANDLGYSDQYAFSMQFKQHTGVSPKAFRNQHIGLPT